MRNADFNRGTHPYSFFKAATAAYAVVTHGARSELHHLVHGLASPAKHVHSPST
jgi:hypothetical protein